MTSQNELRDRIAEVLESVGNAWDAQMMASIVDDKPGPTRPLADAQAQAIIDDLGLTVEENRTITIGVMERVVGRWERKW